MNVSIYKIQSVQIQQISQAGAIWLGMQIGQNEYQPFFLEWLKEIKSSQLSFEQHFGTFLKNVKQKKGLNFVYDAQAAQDIYSLMKDIKYYRFSKSIEKYTKQNGYQLAKITFYLQKKGFIKKREKNKIIQFTDNNHLEGKLQKLNERLQNEKIILMPTLKKLQKQKANQLEHKMLIQNWNRYIPFDLNVFWMHFSVRQQKQNQIVSTVRNLYYHLIHKQVHAKEEKIVKKNIRSNSHPIKNPIIPLNDITLLLQTIVQKNDLFEDTYSLNSISQQIQKVKNQIKSQSKIRIASIQDYGSIKSKLALRYRSDYDITIFTEGPITQKAEKFLLYNIKERIQKSLPYKNSFVICGQHAKVKSLTLRSQQFSSDSNKVDKIDIVINNNHGVNNSRLLRKLSHQRDARNFLLLLKLWAKKNDLIKTYRFSSYGIMLMGIFYMMHNKQIDFLTGQFQDFNNKDCYLPQVNFHDEMFPKLQQQLCGFLCFFSENGQFFSKKLTVALNKKSQCQIDDKFLINMVDPLNKTNPGRFKKNQKATFFGIIASSLAILYQGNQLQVAKLFIQNPKNVS